MATRKEKVQLIVTAKDKSSTQLGKVKQAVIGLGAAFGALEVARGLATAVLAANEFEANMKSLKFVTEQTGRDFGEVTTAMESQLGGLASKAQVASGFLKGMTTTLNVDQINQMTSAIKNASIAMGEDFNQQLPLIIKAVKQLNPAILDNIGVTVRLDQVNKKIREGYFGMGREINEATQQHAIFTEIMQQTQKFQGLEQEFLTTNAGKWQQLSAAVDDAVVDFGNILNSGGLLGGVFSSLTTATKELSGVFSDISLVLEVLDEQLEGVGTTSDEVSEGFASFLANIVNQIPGVKGLKTALDGLSGAVAGLKKAREDAEAAVAGPVAAVRAHVEINRELLDQMDRQVELSDEAFEASLEATEADQFGSYRALENIKELNETRQEAHDLLMENQNILEAEQERIADEWVERWAFVADALTNSMVTLTDQMLFQHEKWRDAIKDAAKQAAQAIVTSLVVKAGQAIFTHIKNLALGSKAEAASAGVKIAAIGSVAAAETAAAGVSAVAKGIEKAATDMLTRSYIALASAKAAASVGTLTAPIIAAGAATKTALEGLLIGFDDPINDRIAMRHGSDYAEFFMEGAKKKFGAPQFGQSVIGFLGGAPSGSPQLGGAGGGTTINLTINGSVSSESFVTDEIVPLLEQAVNDGGSRLKTDSSTRTGTFNVVVT